MTDEKPMTDEELLQIIEQSAETRATSLSLRYKALTVIPREIGDLKELEELDLAGNKISVIPPEIGNLSNLQRLDLQSNRLGSIPPQIGQLKNLKYLYIGDNPLTSLPPEIGMLEDLLVLNLSADITLIQDSRFSLLTLLPPEIGRLTKLTKLDVSASKLTEIPAEIGNLSCLLSLDLGYNYLTNIPTDIGRLKGLTHLNLSSNNISTIPREIWNLINLKSIFINSNNIKEIPPGISALRDLEALHLDFNQLTIVPPELGKLPKLTSLYVSEGNALTSPPPEVIRQGTQAILAYLRNLAEQDRGTRQWVSKLVVVGEGGVGKTSLLRVLRGEPFDPLLDSTHGIRIDTLPVAHPTEPDVAMTLNTWDFGGQEIYHATHQFFLTNRSLFLLAWNARHGFEQGKLYYWLDTIQALAPESPILLVATWTDERDPDLPLTELRQKYPQIAGQVAISNKTGSGIEQLRQAIADASASLPLMGETWPTTWLNAANAIRARPEKHITPYELRKLMAEHGVTDTSAEVLPRWLHELGDILYFPDSEELSNTVILKPQWVTEYISKVLTSEEVIERRGVFSRKQMHALWADLDPGMRDHFLRLMERFDLSYRTLEDRDISLIVERLPFEPSDYAPPWEEIATSDECNAITMRFRLSTVPAGIPTWFIARSHRFTTGKHWRAGALFEDNREGKHLALVRAFAQERYVELAVRGPVPQNFFALLRDGIEVTLKRFPGLEIKRMIPCPCPGENGNGCTHEFDYALLVKRLNKKPEIECPVSLEELSVVDLLFGIDWSTRDAVLLAIEQSQDKILAQVQDARIADAAEHHQISSQIDELTALAQREFTAIFNREQRFVESHCPSVFVLRPRILTGWRRLLDRLKSPTTGEFFDLQLYCQHPGGWHPALNGGLYAIDEPREWFVKAAPLLRAIVKLLPLALPATAWAAPFAGAAAIQAVKGFEDFYKVDVEFTKAIVEKMPDIKDDPTAELIEHTGMGDNPRQIEGASLRALRALLDAKDPQHHWGGLKKVLTPEGHYLWLCEHHAAQYKA
jgi:internalin A